MSIPAVRRPVRLMSPLLVETIAKKGKEGFGL
jgi:hypothetical protein